MALWLQVTGGPAHACLALSETSFICADMSQRVHLYSFDGIDVEAAAKRFRASSRGESKDADVATLQSSWELLEVCCRRHVVVRLFMLL